MNETPLKKFSWMRDWILVFGAFLRLRDGALMLNLSIGPFIREDTGWNHADFYSEDLHYPKRMISFIVQPTNRLFLAGKWKAILRQ
jgi:hypothetical protein